jgi:hypothetical protein
MVLRAIACAALVTVTATCGADRGDSFAADTSAVGSTVGTGPHDNADATSTGAAGSRGHVAAPQPSEDVLTADGWGPLRIGMTRAEIVAAAGEDANPDAVGGPEPDRCDQFRPSRAPVGLLVMVEEGALTRISISRDSDITTPDRISVGDAGSDVLESLGSRAVVEPHKYWQSPGKYVTVWRESVSSDERRGMRYEIDPDDMVVHVHAGTRSIEYVEGCL